MKNTYSTKRNSNKVLVNILCFDKLINTSHIISKLSEYNNIFFSIIVIQIDKETSRTVYDIDSLKNINNITIELSDVNWGYSKGNNRCILNGINAFGKFDYYLICNPDIILTDFNLDEFIIFANKHPNGKIISPRIINYYTGRQEGPYRIEFPVTSFFIRAFRRYIRKGDKFDWCIGSFLLINSEFFDKTNHFNELFFLGNEELYLALQLKQSGYKWMINDNQTVFHQHGSSYSSLTPFAKYFFLESRILFYKNHLKSKTTLIKLHILLFYIEYYFNNIRCKTTTVSENK